MIHPLIRLAARRPELLAEHGQAYVALVGKELSQWKASLVRRAVMGVVAGVGALVSLVYIGVAVMLWGVTPEAELRSAWALFAPPVVALVVTGVAAFAAVKGISQPSVYEDIKAQVRADLAMLREVNPK